MKKLILAFLILTKIVNGQINDDFSDGDFTINPSWLGDIGRFEVNTNHQLHLVSDLSDTSFLVTPNERINNTEWSFWVKLSFNTSANNFGRIYLISDKPDLKKSLNGYYIQIGGGDDSIRLIRQEEGSLQPVYCFRQYKTSHSTNILRFRIFKGEQGDWEAWVDTTGGTNYSKDGTFSEDAIVQTAWFGVFCKYTSSNSTKFYFDNFYVGTIVHDTIPPRIESWVINNSLKLRLLFSENVNKQEAENKNNYFLKGSGQNPSMVIQDPDFPAAVELSFEKPLYSGSYDSLIIQRVKDLAENPIRDTTVRICYYLPHSFDVLIHEIMADAEPQVELPDGEFVELYNRTDFPISLNNWTFQFGKSAKIFPAIRISSHGYLLLVKDSSLFFPFGECFPLFTSGSSLSNEGTTLVLKDDQGHIIHTVKYEDTWYSSSFKQGGGWSLEMTDPSNPCGCAENWAASKDPSGGTPCRANAASQSNPDLQAPSMIRAFFDDSLSVHLIFSEAIDSGSMLTRETYMILPGKIKPDSVFLLSPSYSSAILKFSTPFQRGLVYTVIGSSVIRDCAGNLLDTSIAIDVAMPMEISPGDIIINEVLFNPYSGGSRFVELFNRSSKVLDIKTLILAKKDSVDGIMVTGSPILKESFLFFPQNYIAISPLPEDVLSRYPGPSNRQFIKPEKFPTLDDDSGTIILAKQDDGTIIDQIQYSSDMHYPLLSSGEGVSLERLNPERPSSDRSNWHSASETTGFATPAYQNSQFFPDNFPAAAISIYPPVFSPDNDGKDDTMNLLIRLDSPGFQADVVIYDSRGRLIRKLAENILLAEENIFTWDGITQAKTKASTGIYILFLQLINPDGTVKQYKKVLVLAGQL